MATPDTLAAMIARVARRHDVPPAILHALAPAGAENGTAPAVLERQLSRRALDVIALRRRLAAPVSDATSARWRASAAAALEAGRFAEIDKALAQDELHLLSGLADLSQMPPERRVAAGEARADRGSTCLLTLAPKACREAAQRFAEASAIIGLANAERAHQLVLEQGDALIRLGEEYGDRAGFDDAVAHLRILVSGLDNFDETVRYAATHERLAIALAGLGSLTAESGPTVQAIESCKAALDDLRREQSPALWTRLQRRLGTLALQRGEAENGTDLIEEAVEALRAALAATDKTIAAAEWTQTQFDLGRAHTLLGQRSGGMANLEAAFNAFQATGRDVDARSPAAALGRGPGSHGARALRHGRALQRTRGARRGNRVLRPRAGGTQAGDAAAALGDELGQSGLRHLAAGRTPGRIWASPSRG